MQNSPLFMIPLEVRCIVYEYYLEFAGDDFPAISWQMVWRYMTDEALSNALPNLMLTCKRAYAELRSDVHSKAAIRFYDPRQEIFLLTNVAAYGILRCERLRRLSLIIDVDTSGFWTYLFEQITRRTPALEQLTIEWMNEPDMTEHLYWRDLFQALDNLTSLRTIQIYGKVPGSWKHIFKQGTDDRGIVIREI